MLDFTSLDWMAILVALVVHMVLGMAWFGAFAGPWSRLAHPGKTRAEMQEGPKWVYAFAAGGGLVTAIVLFATLDAVGASTVGDALVVTLLLWAGLVLVKYATTYVFEARSWTLLGIDVGYPLVSMLGMALVYALWP